MMNSYISKDLTIEEIETMDFSTLVAVVREPNMCSGGRETIRTAIKEGNIAGALNILEVGSNTGYSSIEFAITLPDSKVTGIDINPLSVAFATEKAKSYNIKNVEFICSDATNLPFENNVFDVLFVSNVTSFIPDKKTALKEYIRVLKPQGLIVAAPISYQSLPPYHVVKKVEAAIGASLTVADRAQWTDYFEKAGLSLYFSKSYEYVCSTYQEINEYVEMVMAQDHLKYYSLEIQQELSKRLQYFYKLFDENLSYAGFDILIYRKTDPNNIPILHKTRTRGGTN